MRSTVLPPVLASAAMASHRGRTYGSQEPTPSTSKAEVAVAQSADTLPVAIPKLKHMNTMTRKASKNCCNYVCEGNTTPSEKPSCAHELPSHHRVRQQLKGHRRVAGIMDTINIFQSEVHC